MNMIDRHDLIKRSFDAGAIATAFGGLIEMLPAIATSLSIIWMALRIYEMDTTQRQLGRARATIARLNAWLRKGR
ncbi:hypothetical protein M2336_002817 [Sphingobium sp. B1D7B]|uniref:hypothetical protein n=1 Tax=Sphingobium sp. B1D7B TaxID=2940578 RepID=UPI00222434B2|nr:hypothetical protein [Sphingobium sp. B1D7B]MCW2406188.1 hypothetical protein [Sphingobium sp. B1D7B]